VPSTFLFLAIGGLHSAAGGEFWSTWLAGATGAFLGDIVSYAMGRWFKDDIGGIWPFKRNADWYVLTVRFFERWGILGIIGGKFLGFMRPFIPVVAGALHMPWLSFLMGSVLSCLIWAGVFLAPGYGLLQLAR
jgi:membrane protein DedA with SNARE-associated domain